MINFEGGLDGPLRATPRKVAAAKPPLDRRSNEAGARKEELIACGE